jgi:ubiquinone biosynthesis protein
MYNSIQNMLTVALTICFFIKEYICYVGGRPQQQCLFNILKRLAETNTLYIKVLQALSTKDNLFSQQQLDYISGYTDNVPYTDDDIDNNFRSVLDSFSNQEITICNHGAPVKSGTIALIYKGTIDDQEIIIKVARKNIKKKIDNALSQLRMIIKCLTLSNMDIRVDVDQLLSEHRELFLKQTDFGNELRNLRKMKENFKNIEDVVVPKAYPEFTDRYPNMIVMNYIEGVRVEDLNELEKSKFIGIAMKYFLKSFLYDNFYHGDFHPGNVLFITKPEYKLGIIDFGIMLHLTEDETEAITQFFNIIIADDDYYEGIKRYVDTLIRPRVVFSNLPDHEKKRIYSRISDIISASIKCGVNLTSGDLYNINAILSAYGLQSAPSLCKLVMALTVVDSVKHTLTKDTKYIDLIKEYGKGMFNMDILDM